jgi:hypothetical protein
VGLNAVQDGPEFSVHSEESSIQQTFLYEKPHRFVVWITGMVEPTEETQKGPKLPCAMGPNGRRQNSPSRAQMRIGEIPSSYQILYPHLQLKKRQFR